MTKGRGIKVNFSTHRIPWGARKIPADWTWKSLRTWSRKILLPAPERARYHPASNCGEPETKKKRKYIENRIKKQREKKNRNMWQNKNNKFILDKNCYDYDKNCQVVDDFRNGKQNHILKCHMLRLIMITKTYSLSS